MTVVLARRVLACCIGPDGNTVFAIAEAETQPIGTGLGMQEASSLGARSDPRQMDGVESSSGVSSSGSARTAGDSTKTLLVCAWSLDALHAPDNGRSRDSRIAALAEDMGVAPARKPIVIMPSAQRRLRIRATQPRGSTPVSPDTSGDKQSILGGDGVVS